MIKNRQIMIIIIWTKNMQMKLLLKNWLIAVQKSEQDKDYLSIQSLRNLKKHIKLDWKRLANGKTLIRKVVLLNASIECPLSVCNSFFLALKKKLDGLKIVTSLSALSRHNKNR